MFERMRLRWNRTYHYTNSVFCPSRSETLRRRKIRWIEPERSGLSKYSSQGNIFLSAKLIRIRIPSTHETNTENYAQKTTPSLPQQHRPLDSPQPPQPRLFVVVEELLRRVVERRRAVARAASAEELVPLRPLDGLGVVALLVALHRRERCRLDDRGDARVCDVREAEVERDLLDLEGTSSARAVSAEDAGGTTAAGRSVFMSS